MKNTARPLSEEFDVLPLPLPLLVVVGRVTLFEELLLCSLVLLVLLVLMVLLVLLSAVFSTFSILSFTTRSFNFLSVFVLLSELVFELLFELEVFELVLLVGFVFAL